MRKKLAPSRQDIKRKPGESRLGMVTGSDQPHRSGSYLIKVSGRKEKT
jgi:hypothetical protein